MGMISYVQQITPLELQEFRRNPQLVREFLRQEELDGLPASARPAAPALCLEECWQDLHYMLTGSMNEAPGLIGNAILGGTPIGDDLGDGPARFLTTQRGSQSG